MTYRLNDLLTEVNCRATSVAKNGDGEDDKNDNDDATDQRGKGAVWQSQSRMIAQSLFLQLREKVKSKGLSPFQPIFETIKLKKITIIVKFQS